jgi:TIR domain
MVQVFLHLLEQAAVAAAMAREFDTDATWRGARTLAMAVAPGARVQVTLSLPGLIVEPSVDILVWRQRPEAVQFAVSVPPDCAPSIVVGTVRIMIEGTPIGEIRFKVTLTANAEDGTGHAATAARRYRRAFASYASSDRAQVLRRVQALRHAGIEVFQDVLDLEPGQRWERELYRRINECDVVFLFWSTAARESEWVMREIDYALARQVRERFDEHEPDTPAITPILVEGPPVPEPPARLKHLHFNDALLYAIASEDHMRAP